MAIAIIAADMINDRAAEMLETLSADTAKWLYEIGYLRKGLDYPRWQSRIYEAELVLNQLRHYKEITKSKPPRWMFIRAILFQPFSGVRGEWIEQNSRLL